MFPRRGRLAGAGSANGRDLREDEAHLTRFARSRAGVEAFVEPRTAVTDTTVMLVAADGEWTRRRVPGPQAAHQLAHRLGIAAYDAAVVGYPQRMRDWNARIAAQNRAKREP
ncbi:hypothetical protein KGA66_10535 [Actinocrinis puniceicyclus]|uniref:Uncharacterized protein n=1 Tax=Actinocrinis puniceicyclus TaxID=977794 RepID=A0A8J7WMG6_9ACTN|nr:hypothetical protein [Actinocrinis puniceicyclus]MBS2963485.1 hypothetical protein [Actinocrinis puniceicyclus]